LAISAAAVAVATLGTAGCYNPTIAEGFKCNMSYEPGAGDCPDGFHCGPAGLCLRGPAVDAAVDQGGSKPETRVDGPVDLPSEPVAQTDTPPDMTTMMCNMPVQGCTADTTKKCDPVCQTGCGCHEKCSANTMGTLTCNVPLNLRPKQLGEGCNPSSLGTAAQTDDCAPGLVCVNDACNARCYKFCKTDLDCPMSTCTRDAGGGVKICDVQAVTCNPVKMNGGTAGCMGQTQGCYLSPVVKDRTFCDCPMGAGNTNSACMFSRDCFPGLVCVDALGTGSSTCLPVCSVPNGSADCLGGTCNPLNKSTKYGYCSN
jgi:hypothetical protein